MDKIVRDFIHSRALISPSVGYRFGQPDPPFLVGLIFCYRDAWRTLGPREA